MLRRAPALLSGLAYGGGILVTKFILGVFAPPLLLGSKHPQRFLLATSAVLLAAGMVLALLNASPFSPLHDESQSLGAGPSLWRLPAVFTPLRLGAWTAWVALLALGAVWVHSARRRSELSPSSLVSLTGFVFLAVSPKALPMYVTLFWPAVVLAWEESRESSGIWLLAILNFLLGTWWYLDAGGTLGEFGPIIQTLAILWTALIPILALVLAARIARPRRVP